MQQIPWFLWCFFVILVITKMTNHSRSRAVSHDSVVVLEESFCHRRFSRTNFSNLRVHVIERQSPGKFVQKKRSWTTIISQILLLFAKWFKMIKIFFFSCWAYQTYWTWLVGLGLNPQSPIFNPPPILDRPNVNNLLLIFMYYVFILLLIILPRL